jgi:hypothetical protein
VCRDYLCNGFQLTCIDESIGIATMTTITPDEHTPLVPNQAIKVLKVRSTKLSCNYRSECEKADG